MGASPDVQHCLVVQSDSVHRIQETQAALGFALWEAVQQRLGRRGSVATDG
jgi:D-sedoheptulose 7-phosphate isomerase